MRIDLSFPERLTAEQAVALAAGLKVPALVADERHIVKYRNKAASALPFLRCGAKLEKYLSAEFAVSVKDISPGTVLIGCGENGKLPDFAVMACGGCLLAVADLLSARLCALVREESRALPGYDRVINTGIDPFCGAVTEKLGAEAGKRITHLITALYGNGSGGSGPFDASRVLRPVISAADALLGERGYAAFWQAVPTGLYTEGGECDFAAIIASALCTCARISFDNWVDLRGYADGRHAELTVSALTGIPLSCTDGEGRFTPACVCGESALPDLYFARLLADLNRWEFAVCSTPAENGLRRVSATLSFRLSGSVTPASFILREDYGERILAVMKQVFSALAQSADKAAFCAQAE